MAHDKIIIIGCAGCGKSTMARALAEKTALPLYHLDKLWWQDNWTHITREELEAVQEQIMAQPRWIMDGNFDATMPRRLACCDTVVYLDFSRWLCLYSVVVRVLKNLGKARPDMHPGCKEKVDWEFLTWIWNFNKAHRADYYAMLKGLEGKTVLIARKRNEIPAIMAQLVKGQG